MKAAAATLAAVVVCCGVHAVVLAGVAGWATGSLLVGVAAGFLLVAVVVAARWRSDASDS